MLEMPHSVAAVAVVRNTDKITKHELVNPRLLPDFPQGTRLDCLASLLMAFGKIPKTIAADQKIVTTAI